MTSSSLSGALSSVGEVLASALDAAAGTDARVGDALDAAVADYRDSYYGGAPRGGAIVITSPVGGVGFNGNANSFDGDDDETAGGDFDGSARDEDDFTTASRPALTMSSSSSSPMMKTASARGGETAAEEGKRVAREAAASAANALAAARPE